MLKKHQDFQENKIFLLGTSNNMSSFMSTVTDVNKKQMSLIYILNLIKT